MFKHKICVILSLNNNFDVFEKIHNAIKTNKIETNNNKIHMLNIKMFYGRDIPCVQQIIINSLTKIISLGIKIIHIDGLLVDHLSNKNGIDIFNETDKLVITNIDICDNMSFKNVKILILKRYEMYDCKITSKNLPNIKTIIFDKTGYRHDDIFLQTYIQNINDNIKINNIDIILNFGISHVFKYKKLNNI